MAIVWAFDWIEKRVHNKGMRVAQLKCLEHTAKEHLPGPKGILLRL